MQRIMMARCRRALGTSLFRTTTTAVSFSTSTTTANHHRTVLDRVNALIGGRGTGAEGGQTFAVVHLNENQYLVHVGDIIAVRGALAAEVGERIKLEKCLLAGGSQFTLLGRPVLNRDLIQVEATLVEKTMTQTDMNMFHIPRRHGYKRWLWARYPLTMLRINDIRVCHPLNATQTRIN